MVRGGYSCSVWASYCGGFSCCRAQVLGTWALIVVAPGLSCSTACGIFPDQGSNPHALHWQADSYPLYHQGSPSVSYLCVHFSICLTHSLSSSSLGMPWWPSQSGTPTSLSSRSWDSQLSHDSACGYVGSWGGNYTSLYTLTQVHLWCTWPEPSAQLPLSFPCALVVSASMAQHTYSSTTGGALFCRCKDKAPANHLASLPQVLLSKVLLLGQAMGIWNTWEGCGPYLKAYV